MAEDTARRAFSLGFFIVTSGLILAAAIFLIGNQQFLFSETYLLNSQFESVSGLIEGAPVRVGGVRQGTVKDIRIPESLDEKVIVIMKMNGPTRDIIRKDSLATIRTEGLLGDKYVDLSFGSPKAPPVEPEDNIKSEEPADPTEMANAVADAAQKGISAFTENMEAMKDNFLLRGFFEKRGYKDESELTRHAVSRLPGGQPVKEFDFETKDLFDKPDNAELDHERPLKAAGKFLESNPFGQVVISVTGEPTGDSGDARLLSRARAHVVREFLVGNYPVDDTRVKTVACGKPKDPAEGGRVRILSYS